MLVFIFKKALSGYLLRAKAYIFLVQWKASTRKTWRRKWIKGKSENKLRILITLSSHLHLWLCYAQSCLTLCDPMDHSPPGTSVCVILEWVAISFFRASSQPRDRTWVSRVAGRRFTLWATREVWNYPNINLTWN